MNALVQGGGAQAVGLTRPALGVGWGLLPAQGGSKGGFPAAPLDLKGTAVCCLRVFC